MKKRILCLFLILTLCFSSLFTTFAWEEDDHNDLLDRILFSSGDCQSVNPKANIYIEMLEYASYLAIDQYNKKAGDQSKLDFLKENGVKGIISSVDEIDFKYNSLHREFTHRGWDFVYSEDRANWPERKKILQNTADCIFDFKSNSSSSDAIKRRDAFCMLIYYTHILGDLCSDEENILEKVSLEDDNTIIGEKRTSRIVDFARPHPSVDDKDIFFELERAVDILFSNQKSRKYSSLKSKLKSLASEARDLEGQTGGIRTVGDHKKKYEYEKKLTEYIKAYIPLLLDDEDFFRSVFSI